MRIGYHLEALPPRGRGAFTPVPVGGGHTTPTSATHGLVVVCSTGGAIVGQPRPNVFPQRPSDGPQAPRSTGTAPWMVPNRYWTTPEHMLRGVKMTFSPLVPRPTPLATQSVVRLMGVAARRPRMGGRSESTPWPKAWQNYFRRPES